MNTEAIRTLFTQASLLLVTGDKAVGHLLAVVPSTAVPLCASPTGRVFPAIVDAIVSACTTCRTAVLVPPDRATTALLAAAVPLIAVVITLLASLILALSFLLPAAAAPTAVSASLPLPPLLCR